ncbi:MAG: hypothetical protein HWQ38_10525 [Nostoc sp. NMS7]|uniref:hypothetical protein n=1 Tax=Nostoc sp. NMS7 TaxID=2815391 RepID=UPI0025FAAC51|nr:hypothetical protein [Nostoc sp. NMS7]MBN3946893.1 hypothetical protein [Nostoc sp. NMS7]
MSVAEWEWGDEGDKGDKGDEGDKGDKGMKKVFSQCPMPHAQCPISNYPSFR